MTDLASVLMEQIVAKMTVISEQQARSYDGITVAGGEKHAGLAPLTEKPMIDYWRDRFNRAESPHSRRVIVLEAAQALKAMKKRMVPIVEEPERDTFAWRCAIADDPRPIKELQRIYTVSRSTVNRYRATYRGVAKTVWTSED